MKENKSRKRIRRVDAKKTAFGRFVCRLLGDEAGQAIMEYVVLGVLVVAAAVAAALLFGDNIKDSFLIMVYTLQGKTQEAEAIKSKRNSANQQGEKKVNSNHGIINGGESDTSGD